MIEVGDAGRVRYAAAYYKYSYIGWQDYINIAPSRPHETTTCGL